MSVCKRIPFRTFCMFVGFFILCIVFYHSLITTLKKHENDPIRIRRPSLPLSPHEKKMQKLSSQANKWLALSPSEKMERLLENPVYRNFRIVKPVAKKQVTLLLIVSSGPRRADRRKVIRETWWKHCRPTFGVTVECIFFTDLQKEGDRYFEAITKENEQYNDMKFQSLKGGIEFGARFMYHLVWAMTNYNFDYFMRVDDDYFLCLERLLYELPQPMLGQFHWGYVHCIALVVRPEESMIMLSRDLIQKFLSQNPNTMRCHPWADQMLAVWATDLNIEFLFRNDERLHHTPVVALAPWLRNVKPVCSRFIGIHGVYMEDMNLFWTQRGASTVNITSMSERDRRVGNLHVNSKLCRYPQKFNYKMLHEEWQYEPKRCLYQPVWNTRKQSVIGGVFAGRQEDPDMT